MAKRNCILDRHVGIDLCAACGLSLIDGKSARAVRAARISGWVRGARAEGRAIEAHLMRRMGATNRVIAKRLGVSPRTASRYLAMPFDPPPDTTKGGVDISLMGREGRQGGMSYQVGIRDTYVLPPIKRKSAQSFHDLTIEGNDYANVTGQDRPVSNDTRGVRLPRQVLETPTGGMQAYPSLETCLHTNSNPRRLTRVGGEQVAQP